MKKALAARLRRLAGPLLILLLLPLLWFAPVLFSGRTLLPLDSLYTFEPWRSLAAAHGVTTPYNGLISDLVLENLVWKTFIRQSLASGQLPLWNPYLFSGAPFLAAGQHSALYPLSLLFYILPLPQAYDWFTALQLALTGLNVYILARVLRRSRVAATLAGITFAFSAFSIASVVFTMILAAAAWLPLLLAIIEKVIQKQTEKGNVPFSPVPYITGGALILGIQVLAGHIEITYYTLLVMAFFALWRLLTMQRALGAWRPVLRLGAWLIVMAAAGLALAAVQLWPLVELVRSSFREGSASYAQVVGWAWPLRQLITFLLPDFFGNPTHHGYTDLWARTWQATPTIFWGVKNYVEGANYVGVLPVVMAGIGMWVYGRRTRHPAARPVDAAPSAPGRVGRSAVLFFAVLALLSLAFAFGTPLYAILFYGLPGYRQLHSAFRWVFPLTLSLAVLAAFGLDALRAGIGRRWLTRLAWLLLLTGLGLAAAVGLSLVWPGPFLALSAGLLARADLARAAFADRAAFWSYQAPNLLKLALALVAAGAVLRWSQRSEQPDSAQKPGFWRGRWPLLALAIAALDLWLATGTFNPAVDPALLAVEPPAIRVLKAQASQELGRITSLEGETTSKTLNANLGWLMGLQDVRGYDSIILRQYVQYMQAIEPQGQLLYNRISPFYDPASLNDPRTQLLGVRWVITELPLNLPGWTLIYESSSDPVKVYRNENAFPRAFIAATVELAAPDQVLSRLAEVNLRQTVVVDDPAALSAAPTAVTPAAEPAAAPVITSYQPNEVFIDVDLASPGWLVLTDAYFSGWKAYTRPQGGASEDEQALTIWRADGNFRTVHLEAGKQTVRFKYAPLSLQLGLYTSFLAFMALFLLLGWWAWGRYYRGDRESHEVSRVAKNSLVPMGLALLNKGIDFAFALVRLRILSPAGEGSYTFAIGFYVIFEILVRFGLGTLLTREVARDRTQANRYLLNVTVLRGWLWLASLPILAAVMLAYGAWGGLTREEGLAIGCFALALLFAAIADGISAVFNAFEQMEYPSGISSAIALSKVALGALVLLPPLSWGFVGLAGVSVVMNLVQVFWLLALMRSKLPLAPATRRDLDPALQRRMVTDSLPLMLNHLLAHIFFRLDVWILKPLAGAVAVGLYGAAYKYIDGLNVIPSYFTLAIFPLMSRYAQADQGNGGRTTLLRSYVVALRLLGLVSLPIAIMVTFIATPLIAILGGAGYLPGAAVALQLLIWSIPIGFTNSVTQYVLIAVDQQRFLTRAFIIGVIFNVAAKLILIPRFSFYAAAAITGLSELALCIPFMLSVHRHVGPLPWGQIAGRPLLAGLGMAATLAGAQALDLPLVVEIILGALAYVVILILSGAFNDPDMQTVRRALPFGRARAADGEPS